MKMDLRLGLLVLASILSEISGQHPPGVNPEVYQQQGVPQMNAQQAQQLAMQQQQHLAMQQQQQQQMAMQQQAMQQQQIPLQQQQMGVQPQQMGMQPQQVGMQPQQVGMQPQQVGMQPQQMGIQPPQMGTHQQQHPPAAHGGRPPPPPAGQQVFNAQQLEHERGHIGEHVGVPVDTSTMSEQELQFHYFKMHDADNNNKLDGCELVKSLVHWHDQANHDPKSGAPMPDPKIFTDAELVAMIDPILEQDDQNKDGFIDYPEFIQAQQASAVH